VVYDSFIETTKFKVRLVMDQKMTLTEDNLRLAAAYLNMNDEGQSLLETLTKKLAEIPVKPKDETESHNRKLEARRDD